MNKTKFIIALSTMFLIFSCKQNDVLQENIVEKETIKMFAKTMSDSLAKKGSIVPIKVNPDSIKSKLFGKNQNKTFSLMNGLFYDPYLSSNMYALRDMPLTFQARGGGANSANRFLQTNGRGKELVLTSSDNPSTTNFKVRVLPASSGIPYLIYSFQENTPISVGQYSNAPNNKVLFLLNDESGSLYNASWDLIASSSNPGYFAIESQSYLEQGPGGMWDIFYNVVELKDAAKIGYGKYSNKPQQDFLITPRSKFTLSSMEYVNDYNATVTKGPDIILKGSYTNTGYSNLSYDIECLKSEFLSSNFSVNKSINFQFENIAQKFKRPSVLQGVINLNPGSNIEADVSLNSTGYTKNMLTKVPFLISPRTKVAIDYKVASYTVSVDFVAIATYQDREVKISGRWTGRVISDEYPLSDHSYIITDIDTGAPKMVKLPNPNLNLNAVNKPLAVQ
ncbi:MULTISPECIES: hypothetical protein [Sphingobacterium]|uniref:hypothetical protein n=1 Tax=Sphingobacterium TaxID=28453 RepID=UPI0013E4BC1F|nr:hypothetical protein [Sphingobacterium sp. DR205]QIH31504.1 hypothetical protein G6053_00635 [Sphingobacterium sp. DR205]